MEIVADDRAHALIRERGGTLWIWLDGHVAFGGVQPIYLATAFEPPGASKATRRLRSARRPHRFTRCPADDIEVRIDAGTFELPEELHLVYKRWPKPRVDAYWNGAIFVGDDIPPPGDP